jgi:phenylalanyl-tRNA synthetase alpha chain
MSEKMFLPAREQVNAALEAVQSLKDLEALRTQYLGKKGALAAAMQELAQLQGEARRARGAELNAFKDMFLDLFSKRLCVLEEKECDAKIQRESIDVSLPPAYAEVAAGLTHPISHTIAEITAAFHAQGFQVHAGPEIEDAYHNFTALNVLPDHPARASHDTFYVRTDAPQDRLSDEAILLRTHTSPVQIRATKKVQPPLRILAPGRVYRADHDATHTPMFHQVEGLVIAPNIHMGHLKGCLQGFMNAFFGREAPLRFRPSFFPFTEPSAEVDVLCRKDGNDLIIGEGDTWLEVLGCGMVHGSVLAHMGCDPETTQGFAFGMGVERLAMLKYGIADLRAFFENDMRWLQHYGTPYYATAA